MAGTAHQDIGDSQAPTKTSSSAAKPAMPGMPRLESPAMVKKTATAGIFAAKPPIAKISRLCARS